MKTTLISFIFLIVGSFVFGQTNTPSTSLGGHRVIYDYTIYTKELHIDSSRTSVDQPFNYKITHIGKNGKIVVSNMSETRYKCVYSNKHVKKCK